MLFFSILYAFYSLQNSQKSPQKNAGNGISKSPDFKIYQKFLIKNISSALLKEWRNSLNYNPLF